MHRSSAGEGGHAGPPLHAQRRQNARGGRACDGQLVGVDLMASKSTEQRTKDEQPRTATGTRRRGERTFGALAVMLFFYGYDGDSCSNAVSSAFAGGGFGAGGARLSGDLDRLRYLARRDVDAGDRAGSRR